MHDLEVENTLREIRERVLAEGRGRAPEAAAAPSPLARPAPPEPGGAGTHASEVLARMDANLATTGRAWSRLPPILSYRRGAAARLELWVKRLIARAAHWFTWEQVNFNSAVHHALGGARAALCAHEQALCAHEQALGAHEQALGAHEQALGAYGQALARLQTEIRSEVRAEILSTLRAEAEADRARVGELQTRLAQAEARFESQGAQLRHAFAAGVERLAEAQRAAHAELRDAAALRAELHEAQRAEVAARAEELHAEMRRRVDDLLEEQRVCFKQLSLEAGEAAVMHDRARRQLEARLEALEARAATAGGTSGSEARSQALRGGGPASPP